MEQTNTSPIFLGFSSQKGGVGKSTLAEIVSSILYYEKGIELFIVDCDLSQDSFYKLRQREKTFVEGDPLVSQQMNNYFSTLGRVSYRVLKADPKSAIAKAEEHIRKNSKKRFELVVFDFPGHVGTSDLLELSLEMDYILSPHRGRRTVNGFLPCLCQDHAGLGGVDDRGAYQGCHAPLEQGGQTGEEHADREIRRIHQERGLYAV